MVEIAGVGSFSAADYSAGLQAAIVASENAQKTQQQMAELMFRSALEFNRAMEQRRAFGIEERRTAAIEAFQKQQMAGMQVRSELDRLQLQEGQRAVRREERFGEIVRAQVPPTGSMAPVLPPTARLRQAAEQFAIEDPFGAAQFMDIEKRVIQLEADWFALQQAKGLAPAQQRTAEAGAARAETVAKKEQELAPLEVAGAQKEQELFPARQRVLEMQAKQSEAAALLATEQAEERKSRRKLLESGFDKKSIGEISQEFTDEELQATGKSRESLERDIEETAKQLVHEEKLPTRLAIKDRISQAQLVLGLRRQQIEETAIPAESRRITRRVDRETAAITKAVASGISQEQIADEMDDQVNEIGDIVGFNTMENAVQQGEWNAVVEGLNRTMEKMAAQGVTKEAVIGAFRRQYGSEFVEWSRRLMRIDEEGRLIHRHISKHRFDQAQDVERKAFLQHGEEFQKILNMLGIKAEDVLTEK